MKVLFLVNGSESSAAGARARAFADRFAAPWTTELRFRPPSKWKGIAPFVKAARVFRPDICYVMDTAYTGVLAGYLAKKLTGCRLVTDTGDVAYELAKSSGGYSAASLNLIRAVERLAMRSSDGIIVRGSYHKEILEAQGGVRRVCFVPDGVDPAQFRPVDSGPLRRELGVSECVTLGMVGTMQWSERYGMCYGWDIVEALAHLKDIPVRGVLIGDGSGREHLERRAAELGVAGRVTFAGAKPYDDLPRWLCAMDVCVSTQSNDVVGMVRTTGKLPLYMACGRYVAATDVGEARRVLPGVGCLLPYVGVRDDTHPERLAAHVRAITADPSLLMRGAKAREVACAEFDYGALGQRVQQFCESL